MDLSPYDSDVELLPLRRSPLRSFFARLLFFLIFCAVLGLLACEISVVFHVPWLDPRPLLAKAKLAAQTIPVRELFRNWKR